MIALNGIGITAFDINYRCCSQINGLSEILAVYCFSVSIDFSQKAVAFIKEVGDTFVVSIVNNFSNAFPKAVVGIFGKKFPRFIDSDRSLFRIVVVVVAAGLFW